MDKLLEMMRLFGVFCAYILAGIFALAFAAGSFIIAITMWLAPYILGFFFGLVLLTHFFPAS